MKSTCKIMQGFLLLLVISVVTLQAGPALAMIKGPGGNFTERRQQQQESVQLLDAIRHSVKVRRTTLEEKARQDGEDYMSLSRIRYRQMGDEVEKRRQVLLHKIEEWAQSDKEAVLAIPVSEIRQTISQATAVGYYYGLDTIQLSRLYELGKNVIKRSLFELPDSTHPDDDYSYERFKKNALTGGIEGLKPAAVKGAEQLFSTYFSQAEEREIEIAEFLAKKQEYRVLLFKRVTLAYIKALLLSGEPLPACNVTNTPVKTVKINNKNYPQLGCDDPSINYLRQYVNAIRQLQSAESDTFIAHANMVIAQQQLVVDMASSFPLVGDAIDWYSLAYGIWAHEDLTGHCLSYADYAIQFFAAAIPFVGPKMIESAVARNPEVAKRFLTNMNELFTGLSSVASSRNMRTVGATSITTLASNPIMISLAERWGVTPDALDTFSRNIHAAVKKASRREKLAASKVIRQAEEIAARQSKAKMARIMASTIGDAHTSIRAIKELQEQSPEIFERALRDAEDIFNKNLNALQQSQEAAIKNSNMVDEHVDEIMKYMREVADGLHGEEAEKMVLIYRHVNPDSTELIRQGFFTKGMDIKAKSADWGVHRGFIPIEQKFSKLANPDKHVAGVLNTKDVAKIESFQAKVSRFLNASPSNAAKYSTELVVDGMPVMVIKDATTGREITAFFDASTQKFLNEARIPYSSDAIDVSSQRALKVMATPDSAGKPVALTADYDLLAFGFSSEVGVPKYDELTGYISDKQENVLDDINRAIQKATGYKGNVSHHGPEVQYPDSPGAFQDPLLTTVDLDHGVLTIPKCGKDCMRQWCNTTGQCAQFGFPDVSICDAKTPAPPCISIDPDRLLKDYMHLKRLKDYKLFPNSSWGWGDYNPLGGWNMVTFMSTPKAPGLFDSSVRIGPDLDGLLIRNQKAITQKAAGALLKGLKVVTECPYGKGESNHVEAMP